MRDQILSIILHTSNVIGRKIALVEFGQSNDLGTKSDPDSSELTLPYISSEIPKSKIVLDDFSYVNLKYDDVNNIQKADDPDDFASILSCAYDLSQEDSISEIG